MMTSKKKKRKNKISSKRKKSGMSAPKPEYAGWNKN